MDRIWFSPLRLDDRSFVNFAPTFPRRIVEFVREDEKLWVVCVDGKQYEVRKDYLEPRMSFREWAETH
jgi:very-short-patch-repair endonuclease